MQNRKEENIICGTLRFFLISIATKLKKNVTGHNIFQPQAFQGNIC